jgi:elongation factor P
MAIKAIDLRRGMGVGYKGGVWVCVDNQKVAKGNWRSFQVIQLKNIKTGQLIEERFRTDEPFEEAFVERKPMEYLYSTSDSHVLMDMKSYEEVHISTDLIGDRKVYLTPNLEVMVGLVDGKPVLAELPNTVELTVVETPPEVKSATVTNVMKEAVCEGGARIKVPPFVNNRTKIKVDTRTGEYMGKA